MKDEKIVEIDDYRLELENRIRNLLWTISGDYTLNMKVDVSLYLRSKAIALYDGIKQGALAKYYDRNLLGLYLVKKVFCQAGEGELTAVAQLCVEEAIGDKICQERPGVRVRLRRVICPRPFSRSRRLPHRRGTKGMSKQCRPSAVLWASVSHAPPS